MRLLEGNTSTFGCRLRPPWCSSTTEAPGLLPEGLGAVGWQQEVPASPRSESAQHKSPRSLVFCKERSSFLQPSARPRLQNASLNQRVLDIIGSRYIAGVCSATAVQINIFTTAVGLTRPETCSSPRKSTGEPVHWQVISAGTVSVNRHPFPLLIYFLFYFIFFLAK